MANPLRPSPLSFDRQSPFKRQNSVSPATVRATTPTQSPTKASGSLSPLKPASLSPEKANPFARRPSQIGQSSDRPTSPFARPTSGLGVPSSPSRRNSNTSQSGEVIAAPSPKEKDGEIPRLNLRTIPSPFDGPPSPAPQSPSYPRTVQPDLPRPSAYRSTTASSTTSTIKPSSTTSTIKPSPPATNHKLPTPLLRTMRESFEVIDANNTGTLTASSLTAMLEQTGLPYTSRDFFPPNAPSSLNLARYLDILSSPLSELSPPQELMAAFSAFDVDDSGQIDVAELRRALLSTAPEPDEVEPGVRLGEREIDGVLGEFSGRRAFGGSAGRGKGEVFRYREFMETLGGGVRSGEEAVA